MLRIVGSGTGEVNVCIGPDGVLDLIGVRVILRARNTA
jgi:hypothetical protein